MTAAATQPKPEQQERYEWKTFYNITKDEEGKIKKVTIDPLKLVRCYRHLGFRRLDTAGKNHLIRLNDNVIESCTPTELVDEFEQYVTSFGNELPDGVSVDQMRSKYYHQMAKYTSPALLARVGVEPNMNIKEHTKDKAYFFYQNCYVEVTAKGINPQPYSMLDGKVWSSQILSRDFSYSDDKERTPFAQFVRNISNAWELRFYDKKKNEKPDYKRYQQFKQVIGYGLHGYCKGKAKSIILTDSRTDDTASGRSGKTLLMLGLGEMLNSHKHAKTFVTVSGKNFDAKHKFKWQNLGLETKLVHLNDCDPSLMVDSLFDAITEGFEVTYKNESPMMVLAKLFLSTNRTIRVDGESAQDRFTEIETADYYKAHYGPDVEFGHWFFRDWTPEQWNGFDNFMLHCVQQYLIHGLPIPDSINLNQRKMLEETSPEFCKFMSKRIEFYSDEFDQKDLLNAFSEFYSDVLKYRKPQRTVSKWLRKYAKYHPDIDRVEERQSNNRYLLKLVLKKKNVTG